MTIKDPELYNNIMEKKAKIKHPDPKKHQQISFIKSAVRIIGYGLLMIDVPTAAIILIASEAIGIIEELV